MATFSQVAKGKLARKAIDFPLPGARANATDGTWKGDTVKVDVRVLTPSEELDVITAAIATAKKAGIDDPSDGHAPYDLAIRHHTIARAFIDHESPENEPKAFFDGGVEQIMASHDLTREHIAYAFEMQQAWQLECSPLEHQMTPAEFFQTLKRVAEGDLGSFLGMSPDMRWSFTRSTAAQLLRSLVGSSQPGTSSPQPPGN